MRLNKENGGLGIKVLGSSIWPYWKNGFGELGQIRKTCDTKFLNINTARRKGESKQRVIIDLGGPKTQRKWQIWEGETTVIGSRRMLVELQEGEETIV